jgi:CubicO group peptidase (beta-lactamase class C family)
MAVVLPFFLLSTMSVRLKGSPADFPSSADGYLTKLTEKQQFSGAVLVATNGRVLFAKGYGLANREHAIPNKTNTIFRLGSVTKQFTAMCILVLERQQKLSVSNLILQYVEDCPEAWKTITIHHLLNHTAGIPNFTSFPDYERLLRLPTTVEATVGRFKDKPLKFPPGKRFEYSNSHYVLLGYIIEKVSGMPYDRFIAENVFRPLGMTSSGYDHPADILVNRASGYSKGTNGIVNCEYIEMNIPHGAGALYSTVHDMLLWDESIYTKQLVSADSLETMFTSAYGWGHLKEPRKVYHHPGGIQGFKSHVRRYPDDHVYFVVLSNFDWIDPEKITGELSKMFFGPTE